MAQNKQHTNEFENCIEQVMKQGYEKGSAFAICTATFKRAGKPVYIGETETKKLHLFSESIKIVGNRVSGVAIHPKRIFHPEEGTTHVYLKEELEKAAPTLVGKPFGIDHQFLLPPPNVITNAWYDTEQNGVAFEGLVESRIAEQISNKAFKGLSIELDWLRPGGKIEYANGVAPRNFELTSVHLLRNFPPGDKDAFIKVWNGIMEQLVSGPPLPLDQRVETLEKRMEEILNQIAVINGKLEVMNAARSPHISDLQAAMQEAEWTNEYINDLPDDAFAVISKGGQEDDKGKTTPRTLRHLPHHDAEGNLNLPHLRNALARLPQTDLGLEERAEAKRHLCFHAKESDIVSEVCGESPKRDESSDAVALRKQVFDLEGRLAESEKRIRAVTQKHVGFCSSVEAAIPKASVWGAWRPGSKLMVQQLLRLLRESSVQGHDVSHSGGRRG